MFGEQILSDRWRWTAKRSRNVLLGIIALTVSLVLLVQWIDLAALLGLNPGVPGAFLRSSNATWTMWGTQWVTTSAVVIAMARIVRMLRSMADGDPFSEAIISDLRAFAFWILVATILSVFVPVAVPPIVRTIWGVRPISRLEVSGSDLLLLLTSAIFYQVSRLLDAARRLAEDHRQII